MNGFEYYDKNANSFFKVSVNLDFSDIYKRFLKYIPDKSSILDAGCGSGRDTKYFREKGHEVSAFDGSIEMVKLAKEYTGQSIQFLQFENVEFNNEFDAIWASGSILHVKRSDLRNVMERLNKSLHDNGILYGSLLYIEKEWENETYITSNEKEVMPYIEGIFIPIEMWRTHDIYSDSPQRDPHFIHFILKKL